MTRWYILQVDGTTSLMVLSEALMYLPFSHVSQNGGKSGSMVHTLISVELWRSVLVGG